jgi:hypothetical protein
VPSSLKIKLHNDSPSVDVPETCPICHRYSQFTFLFSDFIENGKRIQATFRCGYSECTSFFFCYYVWARQNNRFSHAAEVLTLTDVRPIKPDLASFPKCVHEISPAFISIFGEAAEAAQLRLVNIAGPGYRKAFEFLIKDYAISRAPNRKAEIEAKFSSAVVNDFVQNPKIQAIAKRCLWLGNDETHYLRKWAKHDLEDLVTLIKLSVNWIENEHLSDSYLDAMPDKTP